MPPKIDLWTEGYITGLSNSGLSYRDIKKTVCKPEHLYLIKWNQECNQTYRMGSKTTDRNTPHVRDIFRPWAGPDHASHKVKKPASAKSSPTHEEKQKKSREASSVDRELLHLERHLSMKKTIRKKMMRDLKQAFVDDPNEFKQDPNTIAPEQKININVNNLHLSPGSNQSEHSFLEMLKDDGAESSSATCANKQEDTKRRSIWKIFSSRSKSKSKSGMGS